MTAAEPQAGLEAGGSRAGHAVWAERVAILVTVPEPEPVNFHPGPDFAPGDPRFPDPEPEAEL